MAVDSIWERAHHEPKITLVNTGWTHPQWHNFAREYIAQGKVARVVDATIVNHNPATPFRNVDFIGDAPYYFITDNDCVAPIDEDNTGQSFDQYGFSILDDNPEVDRAGYLLIRTTYVEKFPEWEQLRPYIVKEISDPPADKLPVHPKTGNGIWCEETKKAAAYKDPRLVRMLCDTTFSIVRKPHRLNGANRFSYLSTSSFPTSHIGYLEPKFYHPDYVNEMLTYMEAKARNICPEFRKDYERHLKKYQNLVKEQQSK